MAEDKSAQIPKRVQFIDDALNSVCGIDMRVVSERKEVLLVTASFDRKVCLYSAALNQSIHFQLRSYVSHTSEVGVAHFNKTGTLLLSADGYGKLIVSDVRNMSHPVRITVFDQMPSSNTSTPLYNLMAPSCACIWDMTWEGSCIAKRNSHPLLSPTTIVCPEHTIEHT